MNGMTATEMYQRDARFHAQVTAAVARAVEEAREFIDPDDINMRDLHEVATNATINVLKMVLEGDAELVATRFERDRYKELALSGMALTVMPQIIIPAKDAG